MTAPAQARTADRARHLRTTRLGARVGAVRRLEPPGVAPMPVAIVGIAGRFPGAATVEALWQDLMDGRESICRLEPGELRVAGVPQAHLDAPAYIRHAATVPGADRFDAGFFGLTGREAELTDPQHRLLIEACWRALEDAAIPGGGRIGVYASTGPGDYLTRHVLPSLGEPGPDLPPSARIGNDPGLLAGRVCHVLDLTGPAATIAAGCASALVAVDAACAALAAGRCDAALIAAAYLRLPHPSGYRHTDGGTLSRDGHTRPFDAAASGWVPGGGAAAVVLKPLADAVADHDRIYAVIRGLGVTNNGAGAISFAAPSPAAQATAITGALTAARIDPARIAFIEAHGSGTPLGDAVEVQALAAAYPGRLAAGCGLGSLKANIGHLDAAAGLAALIKTALVLDRQVIPPQINYHTPNPLLELEAAGLVIRDHPHTPTGGLDAAAVSAVGMGGTNAHAILTRAPAAAAPPGREHDRPVGLVVSARTADDLRQTAGELAAHLQAHPDTRLADLAHTLARRARWPAAARLTAATLPAARAQLCRLAAGHEILPGPPEPGPPASAASGRVISLPGHPLHPDRHWITPPGSRAAAPWPHPAPGAKARPTAHRDPNGLLEQVTNIYRARLGVTAVGPDDQLEDLGGSSITALEVADAIATHIGPVIGLAQLLRLGTPRAVAAELRTWPGGTMVDPVLTPLPSGTTGTPVWWLFPASGTTFAYHRIARHLELAAPAYAIAYPFDEPDPPVTLEQMAARCVAEIRAIAPSGPYRLAGYSLGAQLAVEAARQLEDDGETVTDITMIDGIPLSAYPPDAGEADYLRTAPLTLASFLGLPAPRRDATSMEEAVDLLRQPTWSAVTEQTIRRFLTMVVRAGTALSRAAGRPPGRPVSADLTLLAAGERRNPVYDLIGIKDVPAQAWREHTTGRLRVETLPGDHYTLYADPEHFGRLAAALDRIYGTGGAPMTSHPRQELT